MSGVPGAQAVLHAADASLEALLRDVLSDIGIELRRPGEPCARPDVVLALVQRGDSMPRVLETAGAPCSPVVLVLPFADERLARLGVELGARGCYALGTPLEELRRLLKAALSGAAGSDVRGRHDE